MQIDPMNAVSGAMKLPTKDGIGDSALGVHEDPKRTRPKPELTKVSANFVNRSIAALEIASEITGDNQTDVLNRSVQVYAYIMKLIDDGKLIFVEDPATGAKERIVLL